MSRNHVKIESDGTPIGTKVFVDGIELATRAVSFRAVVDEPIVVTVELYADEISIDGNVRLVRGTP